MALFLCCAAGFAAGSSSTTKASFPARPLVSHARSAVLIEAQTGTVLYSFNADAPIAPASLTKLMTLHIALDLISEGKLNPSERIVPSRNAWAKSMPPRSSVMYLGPRQQVSIRQLLQGLMIDSGNDAAVALAERIDGSVPAFAARMNKEAARFGYTTMHFVEPSGISAENRITAREYADFCRRFVALHPDVLKDLLSQRSFTYPMPENLLEGNAERPITKKNTNVMLGRYEGVDGLKTGYLDECGYHMAVTADRDGMRLISVVLGIPSSRRFNGARLRVTNSAGLLDYGFDNYAKVYPSFEDPQPVKVWKGRARKVALVPESQPIVVVPRAAMSTIKCFIEQESETVAPVPAGQVLGRLVVMADGEVVGKFPLQASMPVARGGIVRRAFDSALMLFRGSRRE